MLILIASVGGSPDPIVSCLRARRPAHALFLVTEGDGSRPGSADEIPGILERASVRNMTHELVPAAPDDPETAFLALRAAVRALRQRHPKARLLFDYTGGTKSMTSALFQVALTLPGAEVQFMAGRRSNLVQVDAGSERPTPIPIDWLLAERQERLARAAWARFGYADAAQIVQALVDDLGTDEKAPQDDILRLCDLLKASKAFDAWDRFQHDEAQSLLLPLVQRHPKFADYAKRAAQLARDEDDAPRLVDLWRNAERCAKVGRYDDAVARWYRLVEWTAQWRLRTKHGIDTSNVDWARISPTQIKAAGLETQKDQKTLSGLVQALRLLAALEPAGVMDRFLKDIFPDKYRKPGLARLRDLLDGRNLSILAHGSRPLTRSDWEKVRAFHTVFAQRVLHPLLREVRAETAPPQLPDVPLF